jgi:hypothetical protein
MLCKPRGKPLWFVRMLRAASPTVSPVKREDCCRLLCWGHGLALLLSGLHAQKPLRLPPGCVQAPGGQDTATVVYVVPGRSGGPQGASA